MQGKTQRLVLIGNSKYQCCEVALSFGICMFISLTLARREKVNLMAQSRDAHPEKKRGAGAPGAPDGSGSGGSQS